MLKKLGLLLEFLGLTLVLAVVLDPLAALGVCFLVVGTSILVCKSVR